MPNGNNTVGQSSNVVNHPYFSPSPAELRRLVLSYLCHQCHANSARAFIRDSQRIAYDDLVGWDSVNNGMESGYGKRPIDRDLKNGNAVPPLETTPPLPEPARQHSTHSMEDIVTSAPDAEMQSEYKPADIDTISIPTSDIRTTLESPPESRTPRLKDPDLDEVMTPPPGEEGNEPQYSSIEHAFSRDFTVDATTLGDLRHRSDAIEVDARLDNGVDLQVMCPTELEPINDNTGSERDHVEVDMSEVELRKAIQNHILRGHISEATKLLDTYFPAVLSETKPQPQPESNASSLLSHISMSRASSAHISMARPSSPAIISAPFVFPHSLEPSHLALNLRIQAFVEDVRTRPLTLPPPVPACVNLSTPSVPAYNPFNPPVSHVSSPHRERDNQSAVLRSARDLAQMAQNLSDPTDRAVYLKELDNVWALMAYPEPEATGLAQVLKYMQYDRRVALADQINSAALLRSKQKPRTTIEHHVRSTGAVWGCINDHDVRVPSDPGRYPHGVGPPPSRPPTLKFPSLASGPNRDTVIGPPFDFQRFLATK